MLPFTSPDCRCFRWVFSRVANTSPCVLRYVRFPTVLVGPPHDTGWVHLPVLSVYAGGTPVETIFVKHTRFVEELILLIW